MSFTRLNPMCLVMDICPLIEVKKLILNSFCGESSPVSILVLNLLQIYLSGYTNKRKLSAGDKIKTYDSTEFIC